MQFVTVMLNNYQCDARRCHGPAELQDRVDVSAEHIFEVVAPLLVAVSVGDGAHLGKAEEEQNHPGTTVPVKYLEHVDSTLEEVRGENLDKKMLQG